LAAKAPTIGKTPNETIVTASETGQSKHDGLQSGVQCDAGCGFAGNNFVLVVHSIIQE
jgi:hypothetical protein